MKHIPLLIPAVPKAEHLLDYLRQIDANHWYTNFGPLSQELERRLVADTAPHLGPTHVTTVANCTVGLELALQALGLRPGARVLIPAITFVATATAVLRVGMEPVLGDVDPETWVMTPDIAATMCAEHRIDAVMPVSTFGYAHDPATWDAFAHRTGIPVLVDAAGAYGNQRVGDRMHVVYSFHATKAFAAGEGGAVLSPETGLIARVRKLSNFGIDTSIGQLAEAGTNGKMSEYHCAVGLGSFDAWDETRRFRRALHVKYLELLRNRCPSLGHQAKDENGIYPLMVVALPVGMDVESARATLADRGVETRRWYSPSLNRHPALRTVPYGKLDVAEALGERLIGLPFHAGVGDVELEHIGDALVALLDKRAAA